MTQFMTVPDMLLRAEHAWLMRTHWHDKISMSRKYCCKRG
jgi:hypothetical protein